VYSREHWGKRASRGWQLAVPVKDRFDVVPVRINDERCVIPGVVMRAKTRRAVVAAAGFDSGAVELVNGGSVGCGEGHMNGSGRRFPFPDPEISTALDGEPRPLRALHYLHSERLEGLLVEGAAASHVTYPQGQVVDEGKRHGQRHALYLRARPSGNIPELWGSRGCRHLAGRGQRRRTRARAKLRDGRLCGDGGVESDFQRKRGSMAVGIRIKLAGVTQEQFDGVHDQINRERTPPKGLLFHASGPIDGGWGIIDFWESREDFDTFAARFPEGMAAAGVETEGPPDIKEFPVHEMIHA
jgi:hypothetical protein